jgi:lupus La protein
MRSPLLLHPSILAFLLKALRSVQMPMIQSTAPKNGETNGKRAREDDGAAAPPAKKIDTKTEA